jgi:diguanylate cyclase (GGDEF)-like protein/PAS domain S-box-containing protein
MPTELIRLPESELLEYLRRQVDKMAELEHKIASLEQDREELLRVACNVDQRLREYEEIKEGWDWFFTNSLDMIIVHDVDGRLLRVNPAVERLLGYTPEEFMHMPVEEGTHPDDLERVLAHMRKIAAGTDGVNFEARTRHKDGRYRWLAWTTPAPTKDGRTMTHTYAIARDVTESRLTQQELLYRAQHDALTGLANRAAFDHELGLALARAERLAGPVSLLLIDLDGFKQVNDTLGHLAGDGVLRTVAARLRAASRKGDMVARLGGDEFACITTGASRAALDALATRMLEVVCEPVAVGDVRAQVGCSIGIATAAGDYDPVRLFDAADCAMYGVKARGKRDFAHAAAPA